MSIAVPGFNRATRTCPPLAEAMENLARYVACLRRKAWRRGRQVRASFSQERMTYISEEAKVVYRSKDGKNEKTFSALEWLAAMFSHVPCKEE